MPITNATNGGNVHISTQLLICIQLMSLQCTAKSCVAFACAYQLPSAKRTSSMSATLTCRFMVRRCATRVTAMRAVYLATQCRQRHTVATQAVATSNTFQTSSIQQGCVMQCGSQPSCLHCSKHGQHNSRRLPAVHVSVCNYASRLPAAIL